MALALTLPPPPPPDCKLKDSLFSLGGLYLRVFRAFLSFFPLGKNTSFFALLCLFCCFPSNAFACGGNTHFPPIGFSVLAREYSAEAVTCKYCGRSAPSAKQLSRMGICPNSPSKNTLWRLHWSLDSLRLAMNVRIIASFCKKSGNHVFL